LEINQGLTRDVRPHVASYVRWGCLIVIGPELYVSEHLIPLQPCRVVSRNAR